MDTSTTEEMVHRISNIPEEVGASVCFGAPVERDGHTLIPVARVSFGFGMGFGHGRGPTATPSGNGGGETGEGEGAGGGGGGSSTPVAVIDISRDEVTVRPIMDQTRMALTWMAVSAWLGFWLLWTIRTATRQGARTKRLKIEKGLAT